MTSSRFVIDDQHMDTGQFDIHVWVTSIWSQREIIGLKMIEATHISKFILKWDKHEAYCLMVFLMILPINYKQIPCSTKNRAP